MKLITETICLFLIFALFLFALSSCSVTETEKGEICFSASESVLLPAGVSLSLSLRTPPAEELLTFLPFFVFDGLFLIKAEASSLFSFLSRLCA